MYVACFNNYLSSFNLGGPGGCNFIFDTSISFPTPWLAAHWDGGCSWIGLLGWVGLYESLQSVYTPQQKIKMKF